MKRFTLTRILLATALLIGIGLGLCAPVYAAPMPKWKVRRELVEACDFWKITNRADRAWIIGAGLHIAYGESSYDPRNVTGQHLGLWQFNRDWRKSYFGAIKANAKRKKHWHPNGDWRACPDCSTKRFVLVVKQKGRAGVRGPWEATVGNW